MSSYLIPRKKIDWLAKIIGADEDGLFDRANVLSYYLIAHYGNEQLALNATRDFIINDLNGNISDFIKFILAQKTYFDFCRNNLKLQCIDLHDKSTQDYLEAAHRMSADMRVHAILLNEDSSYIDDACVITGNASIPTIANLVFDYAKSYHSKNVIVSTNAKIIQNDYENLNQYLQQEEIALKGIIAFNAKINCLKRDTIIYSDINT